MERLYEVDMDEQVASELDVVAHQDPMRPKVYRALAKLSNLRGVDITQYGSASFKTMEGTY